MTINGVIMISRTFGMAARMLEPGRGAPTLLGLALVAGAVNSAAIAAEELQEITVTATRQTENINKVPISITAFTAVQMDEKHLFDIDELALQTPGLQFHHTAGGGNGNVTTISVRGIQSNIGEGTTGVYIDDTPVQIRKAGLSFTATNAYPQIFDIDRVEVLRGPQGTLFGSGSMGGAVRFISTAPSLDQTSFYTRDELSYTEHGDPNMEASAAVGGPIVDDVLGFRISARFRRDGGFIDQEPRAQLIADQQRAANGVGSVLTGLKAPNVNWQNAASVHMAMTWKPASGLTVTPSLYYQNIHANSSGVYWDYFSRPGAGTYFNGDGVGSPYLDHWTLAAVNVAYEFPAATLISNTSYMDRRNTTYYDGTVPMIQLTALGPQLLSPQQFLPNLPDFAEQIHDLNQQLNWTEEVRLQSPSDQRLAWVVGGFFQSTKSTNQDFVPLDAATFTQFSQALGALQNPPQSYGSYSDLFYGASLINNQYTYQTLDLVRQKQLAGFLDVTWAIVPDLKLAAGLRYTHLKLDASSLQGGPYAGTSDLEGFSASQSESSTTPRGSATWQFLPGGMIYATVAKGFRGGGVNQPLPSACDPALASVGLTKPPDQYSSDNLMSYELGTKNRIGNNINIAASVFYIRWRNIQQSVYLGLGCNRAVTLNANSASSRGFDLQTTWAVMDDLVLDGSMSYTKAVYDSPLVGTADPVTAIAPIIINKGNSLSGVVPWTATLGASYTRQLFRRDNTARLDVTYSSRQGQVDPTEDPLTTSFLPYARFIPSITQVNARYAVRFGAAEAALFIDNLFDAHPSIPADPGDQFNSVTRSYTLRPRTFGVNYTFRY